MSSIRVLHCNNDNKNLGGAYLIEHRIEPYMRRYGYIYDYITMDEFVMTGNKEIDPMQDAKLFSAQLRKNRLVGHVCFPKFVCNILKKNKYKIVHIDIDSAWKALLYAIPAKKYGSKVIVHSHSTGIDGNYKVVKKFFHVLTKYILQFYTDLYVGCSEEANCWLAPHHILKKTIILKNGVDKEKYYYDPQLRDKCRKELKINEKDFVIGNVARINDNKNQSFLVDILREFLNKGVQAKLLLVGAFTEEAYDKLYEKILEYDICENVLFSGETNDVNYYLNAMDYFVFPSIFEGFGLSVVEAQAAGLKCLISSTVPNVVIETNLAKHKSLKDGARSWMEFILDDFEKDNDRKVDSENIYSLNDMAKDMSRLYKEVLHE